MVGHTKKKAWVVSVNMGYGHERAAYGLEDLAYGGIVTANDYPGIPERDRRLWSNTRMAYEFVSRLQPIPVLGSVFFGILDDIQRIPAFYPRRDLSRPTLQVREIYRSIRKHGLGRHLVDKLSRERLPLISTFFLPAFAAEEHGYPGDIYIVTCDADISRAWAPLDPKKSRIKYFAANGRVVERLKLYGVREENIFLTGFPLPKKTIGGPEASIVKSDLSARICNLDPNGIFIQKYWKTLQDELGPERCEFKKKRPLTVTFCVGGAGAQQQIGADLMAGLRKQLLKGDLRLNLEAGTRMAVADFYREAASKLGLKRVFEKTLHIHAYHDRRAYFRTFTQTLRTTDILWTKPSELSFYAGIGLPIVMAPPVGSQEDFNRKWLMGVNAGTDQLDPKYVSEWLFDWIDSGGLARYAWNGYIEAPTHGAYRIEQIITGEQMKLATLPLIV
ncbi:MAG TPA: hypothetical protein VMU11_03290 [Verrucomicrobiae bacterium]|nr:hypothetical protein [Verrucomicrobiae bacterium]